MTDILKKIAGIRLERLASEKRIANLEAVTKRAAQRKRPLDFLKALAEPGPHIIAEVKKASPSKGVFKEDFDPVPLVQAYERGGASAVSVLTEQDHFFGSIGVLESVRQEVSLPLLRKDFITDPYQVIEARAAGADSFLLIVGLLDLISLRRLMATGRAWRMEPLVEVHDLQELSTALEAEAKLIGINNRNLTTFGVDLEISLRLVKSVPKDCTVISESGIRTREDIMRLAEAGIKGFLIGESLVTASDPATKIQELIYGS
ncbi:MAG TPA: indole-3-glycerol phosphate synthase TrpC [Desulfomonilaceae bacterium]|nr:indole-3-glycerol phosphate synthase TrpC [Desulfomonilaceae bacterium]